MKTRPGHKLPLRGALATIVVAALAWPGSATASPQRHAQGPTCGLRAGSKSDGRLGGARCGLRPNTAISPEPTAQVLPGRTASFRFSSTRVRSRFRCKVDRRAWLACRSPARHTGLDRGSHRFSVRAIAPNGLADLTPATIGFEIAPRSDRPARGAADLSPEGEFEDGQSGSAVAAEPPLGSGGAPFTTSGVWAEPLAANAPVDPQSPLMIDTLKARIRVEEEAGIGPRLGADTRTPLYRVAADQPRIPVFLDTGPWGNRLAEEMAAGVPVPPIAEPVAGTDHAMAVWQASTDTYWEFFKMQQALHGPQFARSPKVTAGCSLKAGAYTYEVTVFNANGETPVEGGRAAATVSDGACITIQWGPIHGAAGYKVYRGDNGSAATLLSTVPAGQSSLLDDGASVPTGEPPPAKDTAETPGEWHAAYGGIIEEVSASPGYYRNLVDLDGTVRQQANWGAAATGLPLAAGLITREDVARGSVDHVLAIGLANRSGSSIIRAGSFAAPAQRADGKSVDPGSIPEGARLRLDPDLDLDSLSLSPFTRLLADATQRYGMIVQDGSQSTVVYAEDPSPMMREGWANFIEAKYGRRLSRAVAEFPWDDLEVVQMHLCQRGPCIPG
jgi:hypothetical protein